MKPYEKLGSFYLGRVVEPAEAAGATVMYDAKDLTTHGVCVGMTGSGKTGLCLSVIEEAALDGIPVLAIDPKGDLGNLLLSFPGLAAGDFEPWVDPAEAGRKGMSVPAYAERVAGQWREGLAGWDQDGERIRRMRESADFCIYTPGSTAGRGLALLRSFAAPPAAVRGDGELLGERISASVSGLLSLLGVSGDPLQSREHLLLSTLLREAWEAGRDLDLPGVLQGIQSPPFDRVGFFDLETFYPAKDRTALAMRLNQLLAAPGFSSWLEGDPLDIQALLYTPEGKARVSILSIAHLNDRERMFFVTLLLNEVIAWMRTQAGTGSLRALLYMDEIFGFFPPNGNPPSKPPMLTLLKQARAFGLGCLLATQNPVDLDYKGLSNTGTWFIGRLQTERDKARVMDGLEGASGGGGFDRGEMDRVLSGLGSRRFLLHNVHAEGPVVFETRWVLSYLRGPLTREQIRTLSGLQEERAAAVPAAAPVAVAAAAPAVVEGVEAGASGVVLPAGVAVGYLPVSRPGPVFGWVPCVGGIAKLHYVRAAQGLDVWVEQPFVVPLHAEGDALRSGETEWLGEGVRFAEAAGVEAPRGALPAAAGNPKQFAEWEREMKGGLYEMRPLVQQVCAGLKLVSEPGEAREAFQGRVHHAAREARDREVEALRSKYALRFETLKERIRRAEDRVKAREAAHQEKKLTTVLNFGTTLLGAFLGQKKVSVTNVNRAKTTLRSAGRLGSSKDAIARELETLEVQREKLAELEEALEEDLAALQAKYDPAGLVVEERRIPFRKSDLRFEFFGLVWRAV